MAPLLSPRATEATQHRPRHSHREHPAAAFSQLSVFSGRVQETRLLAATAGKKFLSCINGTENSYNI